MPSPLLPSTTTDYPRDAGGPTRLVLLLLFVVWATVPGLAESLGTGLDRSWVVAVQLAAARGLVWGRDIMWTYGPLGAIAHPVVGIDGYVTAAVGRILLALAHWCVAALYLAIALRSGNIAAVGATAALALSGVLAIADSAIMVVLCSTMAYATVGPGRRRAIAAMAGAVLSALALLVKFNLGVVGALSVLLWAITEPRAKASTAPVNKTRAASGSEPDSKTRTATGTAPLAAKRVATALPGAVGRVLAMAGTGNAALHRAVGRVLAMSAMGSAALHRAVGRVLAMSAIGSAALIAAWLATGASLTALGSYVRDGWRMSAGFSSQLAVPGPSLDFLFAAVLVAPLAVALIAAPADTADAAERRRLLLLAPFAFGLFKAAFVRHDLHAVHWFVTAPALVVSLVAFASPGRAKRLGAALIAMVLISMLWIATMFPPPFPWPAGSNNIVRFMEALESQPLRTGYVQTGNVQPGNVQPGNVQPGDARSNESQADRLLPDSWHKLIGTASVDAYPWDIAEIVSDGLNWRPRYVPQSYQSYHASLDRASARSIQVEGPEYVVYRIAAVDNLHPAVVDPATWLVLWDSYDIVDESGDRLLLGKRGLPRIENRESIPCPPIRNGSPWAIPSANSRPVLAYIDVSPTRFGRLMSALWRVMPPEIAITRFDGSSDRRRVVWHTLRNGILVSHLPDGPASVRPIFGTSVQPHAVSQIVLHAEPGLWRPVAPARCEALVLR